MDVGAYPVYFRRLHTHTPPLKGQQRLQCWLNRVRPYGNAFIFLEVNGQRVRANRIQHYKNLDATHTLLRETIWIREEEEDTVNVVVEDESGIYLNYVMRCVVYWNGVETAEAFTSWREYINRTGKLCKVIKDR